MDILTATKEFEKWVSGHTQVVKSQFSDKHKQMAESPVQFLRGTFYRWTQLFPEICPELRKAPAVLSVGDLHIASFGTILLGTPRAPARIVADLNSRSGKWLRTAVKDMAAATIGDWREWKKS